MRNAFIVGLSYFLILLGAAAVIFVAVYLVALVVANWLKPAAKNLDDDASALHIGCNWATNRLTRDSRQVA